MKKDANANGGITKKNGRRDTTNGLQQQIYFMLVIA